MGQSQKLWRPARAQVRSDPTKNSWRKFNRRRKSYAAAEKIPGGGMSIRGGRGWTGILRKISHCQKPTRSTQHHLNTCQKFTLP